MCGINLCSHLSVRPVVPIFLPLTHQITSGYVFRYNRSMGGTPAIAPTPSVDIVLHPLHILRDIVLCSQLNVCVSFLFAGMKYKAGEPFKN